MNRLTSKLLGWLLNATYVCLIALVSPVLVYRTLKLGKYRAGWSQKLFGRLPSWAPSVDAAGQRLPRYWFHAVSVGEVLLLKSVLEELARRQPEAEIFISTTTTTGQEVARQKYPHCRIGYCPLDFTWAVEQAMQRIRPTQMVLVELELWPNLILAAKRHGIRLTLINGRLSERSFRGYSRIAALMRPLLRACSTIATQDASYAQRFLALGADSRSVHITGSVKFDRVQTDRQHPSTKALRAAFGLTSDAPVFIAGSTQAPEELIAIRAWQASRELCPTLRLILVPRHQERFAEVARLVTDLNLPLRRRSENFERSEPVCGDVGRHDEGALAAPADAAESHDPPAVLLLDTLGELTACWGLADFAFVGGSLTNRGGQNMIEPAGYGAAVCFGPNTRHFRDTVASLLDRQAAIVVRDEADLAETLKQWLAIPQSAKDLGRRAQEFVLSQRGASARTVDLLLTETVGEMTAQTMAVDANQQSRAA